MRRRPPPRARAPRTGTYFDVVLIDVPCPKCLKHSKQPIAELVANDTAPCGYCGFIIDLTTEGWRTSLAEQAEKFKEIKPM